MAPAKPWNGVFQDERFKLNMAKEKARAGA